MKLFSGLIIVFQFAFLSQAIAQNLVINPGMEDTVSCPPVNNILLYCHPWYAALRTPDYYRENCSINGCCQIAPNAANGFQIAHSGISFLGIGLYDKGEFQAREFIGGKLSDSLLAGHKYCV